MNHQPKIIEDAVEESLDEFRATVDPLTEGVDWRIKDLYEKTHTKLLTKSLTQIHTQAKKEERQKIAKMFEGLPNEIDFETMAQKVRYIWQSLSNTNK